MIASHKVVLLQIRLVLKEQQEHGMPYVILALDNVLMGVYPINAQEEDGQRDVGLVMQSRVLQKIKGVPMEQCNLQQAPDNTNVKMAK